MKDLEDILKSPQADIFFQSVLDIKNIDDCKNFMRDLCTISELKSMIERLDVAHRVSRGQTYRSICEDTGVSSATITRVAHWLKYGNGGYKNIIEN